MAQAFTTAEIIDALSRGVSAKELIEMQKASSAAGAEQAVKAPSHWLERDLTVDCCEKTFRTEKGRAFHVSTAHR